MGGGGSKRAQLLDKYGQSFSSEEKEAAQACFLAIAKSEEAESFSEQQLQAYLRGTKLSLLPETIAGLYRALGGGSAQQQVSFSDFILHTSHLLHGSHSQESPLIHKVCTKQPTLTLVHLHHALSTFLDVILTSETAKLLFPQTNSFKYEKESLSLLVSHLIQPLKDNLQASSSQASEEPSLESLYVPLRELEKWLTMSSLAARIFEVGFALCFYHETLVMQASSGNKSTSAVQNYVGIDTDSFTGEVLTERLLLPLKTQHPLFRESFDSKLLDQSSLMLLNSYLTPEVRGKFYPLFSSVHHGESFSTFCKQLIACKGPTVVVVRDKGGNVFGGCATEGWQISPQFSGNANCFLFKLFPEMGVYVSTGYNTNYMYLQQNAQTLPNGLGMGGQLEYFGLWLSADFGKGHSKAKPKCSTYGSPMLSSTEEFEVDALELWGVGNPVLPDEEAVDTGKPSILDVDLGATAMLKLAGKTIHSEDVRELEVDDTDK